MASTIRSSQGRARFIPIPARAPELAAPPPRRRIWVVLALLAGYLLFCHGCHGDEDNELFVRAQNVLMIRTVAPR